MVCPGRIVIEADAAHDIVEPFPHFVAVELAEQRSVEESHPAAAPLVDVVDERFFGLLGIHLRRIT